MSVIDFQEKKVLEKGKLEPDLERKLFIFSTSATVWTKAEAESNREREREFDKEGEWDGIGLHSKIGLPIKWIDWSVYNHFVAVPKVFELFE